MSDITIVQAAYDNIEATGLFQTDLKIWRGRDAMESTYAHFKIFFIAADKDRTRITAADMGFRSANAAQRLPSELKRPASEQAALTAEDIAKIVTGILDKREKDMADKENEVLSRNNPGRTEGTDPGVSIGA